MGDFGINASIVPIKIAVVSQPILQWQSGDGPKNYVNFIKTGQQVQPLQLQLLQSNQNIMPMEAGITTPGFDEQIRKLKGEKQKLLQEMQKLEDSNTEFCQKAVIADIHLEQLESKFKDLQKDAKSIVENAHDFSLLEQVVEDPDQNKGLQKLQKLCSKILEVKFDVNKTTEETVVDLATSIKAMEKIEDFSKITLNETKEESVAKTEHILRTAKLSNRVQEVSKAISMKEELAKQISASEKNMKELKSSYKDQIKKLLKELVDHQNERDALTAALKAAQKAKECQNEIQSMKAHKVKLMRQIKEENTKFHSWNEQKERENRKRQYEIINVERDFNKQKNVLRRKTEEAAASNRRLKEALMKQRITAEKKMHSQSRMKVWIEEEIEMSVSAEEAKNHLDSLEEELCSLNDQLQQMENGKSPAKRRRTFNVNDINETQRRELINERELKEVQIKELQSKLVDAQEARNRQQSRLLQITNISEARSIMKHLFSLVVDSRICEEACRKEATNLHDEVRTAQVETHRLEKESEETINSKDEEISRHQSVHQEQANVIHQLLNEKEENEAKLKEQEDSVSKKIEPAKETDSTEEMVHEELGQDKEFNILPHQNIVYIPSYCVERHKTTSTNVSQGLFCACAKLWCNTRKCKCRKAGMACTELCKCANCNNALPSYKINSIPTSNSAVEIKEINNNKKDELLPVYHRPVILPSVCTETFIDANVIKSGKKNRNDEPLAPSCESITKLRSENMPVILPSVCRETFIGTQENKNSKKSNYNKPQAPYCESTTTSLSDIRPVILPSVCSSASIRTNAIKKRNKNKNHEPPQTCQETLLCKSRPVILPSV